MVALGAQPTPPPEVAGLFYIGKNHLLSGEPEAGKSWLALAAAADEMKDGHGVLWVDADDVGAGDLLERLRALGVADDKIAHLFAYVLPDEPLAQETVPELVSAVRERDARLAVFDGFNPLLAFQGLDPNSGVEVERLYQLLDPIRKAGAASVLTDNVVKSSEARGKWAIGSERKKSKAEVHLGVRLLEPFGRDRTGKARLEVFKDRPGHLRASPPGLFALTSDGDRCTWQLEADHSRDEEGEFRPTGYMVTGSRRADGQGLLLRRLWSPLPSAAWTWGCPACTREYERNRSGRVRNTSAWQKARATVRRRDGQRCQQCGTTQRLEVHHLNSLKDGGDAFALSNLVTLCSSCHPRGQGGHRDARALTPHTRFSRKTFVTPSGGSRPEGDEPQVA